MRPRSGWLCLAAFAVPLLCASAQLLHGLSRILDLKLPNYGGPDFLKVEAEHAAIIKKALLARGIIH